jgi:hypothetical protein
MRLFGTKRALLQGRYVKASSPPETPVVPSLWLSSGEQYYRLDGSTFVPTVAATDRVYMWRDALQRNSTSGTRLVNGNASFVAQRPYLFSGTNGRLGLRFDGSHTPMGTTNWLASGLGLTATIFVVAAPVTITSGRMIMDGQHASGIRRRLFFSGSSWAMNAGGGSSLVGRVAIAGRADVIEMLFANSAASALYINGGNGGVPDAEGDCGSGFGTAPSTFTLAAEDSHANPASIDIYEVLYFPGEILSAADRQTTRQYLFNKFGIS